jgi:hypothetical protein
MLVISQGYQVSSDACDQEPGHIQVPEPECIM